ncbi:hypothetical protein [Bacillus mycoides]|uniref:hypothetical protein n=1 Tax=Bacillus mycoides TaxID=1405 RepID=UPI0001A052D2|nr:hypothetical protein [Bacillus mycoides]EEL02974.1 peptidylprolyl isomerase [Bacillus cereus BDRD-ST196]
MSKVFILIVYQTIYSILFDILNYKLICKKGYGILNKRYIFMSAAMISILTLSACCSSDNILPDKYEVPDDEAKKKVEELKKQIC